MAAHSSKLQEIESIGKKNSIKKILNLQKLLTSYNITQEYEIAVIDTPPSKGFLTISAIKAANYLIIPTQMEQFSVEGIYGMLQLWKQEIYSRTTTNPITLIGIIPNQIRDINLHKQVLDSLKKIDAIKKYIIPYKIKKRAIYSEILIKSNKFKSIFELPTHNIARQECEKICNYIIKRVFDNAKEKSF